MKILFNGCSMVEMITLNTLPSWEVKIWPYLLAEKLNLEYINIGKTMSSNRRIFKTTVDYLLTHNDIDVVFVGWTSMDRVELPLSNGDFVRMTPHGECGEHSGPAETRFYKDYYKYHYNEWSQGIETFRMMYLLDCLCQIKNIKLWNINSIFDNYINRYKELIPYNFFHNTFDPTNPTYQSELEQMITLNNHVVSMNWAMPIDQSLTDFCSNNSLDQDEWGHPLLNAQESIMEVLFKSMHKIC